MTSPADPPQTWLQLLLSDATADELDAHRRALGAGNDVESEARRALQLQSRLRDRTQRAASLSALSDIASRLASVRDLAELLHDIAVQARHLLRTDITYLALLEHDALRIRYFDGVLGPAAREIRLSLTNGLAGRIMATGRSASSQDYLEDHSIEHHPQADFFAQDERLRSVLGVPLRGRGSTLGVLFAAERGVRPFTDDESSLLAGLAGHAAVAIENARLFDAERAAVAEVRLANDMLTLHAATVDRAIVLHERLTQAAVRGGGPTQVVKALSDVLDLPVQLVDAADRPLAGPDLQPPSPLQGFVTPDRRTVMHDAEGGVMILCSVIAADEYLGCLVVRGTRLTGDAEVRLLERGALAIALSLLQQRALTEAATRSRGELLVALIEGGDVDVLERRAAGMRIDLSKEHVVALVEPEDSGARAACAELARRSGGLHVERSNRIVLLLPAGTDLDGAATRGTVGVSTPTAGASELPHAYAVAHRCLQATLALGRRGVLATAQSLGIYGFLLASSGPQEAAQFVDRTIGPLLRHDAARSTELTKTLEEYLGNGRQHTAAAQALHIHPNTLYQRLARIGVVLGESWREPDEALNLLVALRLHRLSIAL